MKTFIRVVEVWLPDATGSMLELGGGIYTTARRFGAASRDLCFGRGEGLPGQAWERGRPIVLKQFEGSYFRRTELAATEGLTCGIALPLFAGDKLNAVLVFFCGDDTEHAGAIELWHANPTESPDMTLDDGYYGTTSEVFEFISRQTAFREGIGLPGMTWASGLPTFLPDLHKGTRFLRGDSARQVGINRGLAVPAGGRTPDVWVLAFLSALATPIARRFEVWSRAGSDGRFLLGGGCCESQGMLVPDSNAVIESGLGVVGRTAALGVPMVTELAADEPGPIGAAARVGGWTAVAAMPVLRGPTVVAVVAFYF